MTSNWDRIMSGRSSDNAKKIIQYHSFYVDTTKQASEYDRTLNVIISHIKKDIWWRNGLAKILCTLVKYDTIKWNHILRVSTETVLETKKKY